MVIVHIMKQKQKIVAFYFGNGKKVINNIVKEKQKL